MGEHKHIRSRQTHCVSSAIFEVLVWWWKEMSHWGSFQWKSEGLKPAGRQVESSGFPVAASVWCSAAIVLRETLGLKSRRSFLTLARAYYHCLFDILFLSAPSRSILYRWYVLALSLYPSLTYYLGNSPVHWRLNRTVRGNTSHQQGSDSTTWPTAPDSDYQKGSEFRRVEIHPLVSPSGSLE